MQLQSVLRCSVDRQSENARVNYLQENESLHFSSNETQSLLTFESLKNYSIPAHSAVLAVGLFTPFDIASCYGLHHQKLPEKLLCVDLYQANADFIKKFIKLFQQQKPADRFSCLNMIQTIITKNIAEPYARINELNKTIESGDSWLSSDERFQRISKMIIEQKVEVQPTDLANPVEVEGLLQQVESSGLRTSLSYLSSVREYVDFFEGEIEHFASAVKSIHQHNPNGLILDTVPRKAGIKAEQQKLLPQRRIIQLSPEQVPTSSMHQSPHARFAPSNYQRVQALAHSTFVQNSKHLISTNLAEPLDLIIAARKYNPSWKPQKITVYTNDFLQGMLFPWLKSNFAKHPKAVFNALLKTPIVVSAQDKNTDSITPSLVTALHEQWQKVPEENRLFQEENWKILKEFSQIDLKVDHLENLPQYLARSNMPNTLIWSDELQEKLNKEQIKSVIVAPHRVPMMFSDSQVQSNRSSLSTESLKRESLRFLSNEEDVGQSLKELETLTVNNSAAVVGFGIFSTLDLAASYGLQNGSIAKKLYCVDAADKPVLFLKEFIDFFKNIRPASAQDCVELIQFILESDTRYSERVIAACMDELNKSIRLRHSWLSDHKRFERVSSLIFDDKVEVLQENLGDPDAVGLLLSRISTEGLQPALLYLSNVREYVEQIPSHAACIGPSLTRFHQANPELILVDTHPRLGGIRSQDLNPLKRRVTHLKEDSSLLTHFIPSKSRSVCSKNGQV